MNTEERARQFSWDEGDVEWGGIDGSLEKYERQSAWGEHAWVAALNQPVKKLLERFIERGEK